MEVQVETLNGKHFATLKLIEDTTTIGGIKKELTKLNGISYFRQEIRLAPKSRALKNEDKLSFTGWKVGDKLYLKDLGLQINWRTVFFCEYIGPIIVYLTIYSRRWILYGPQAAFLPYSTVTNLAAILWVSHFLKQIVETIFVHRFSRDTMPIFNLFKNCSHYYTFGGLISYYVSHPSYQAPTSTSLVLVSVALFLFFEYGNMSIHSLLSEIRPPETKVRKIPYPNSDPMTLLFNYVSCPHYTYETGIWAAFSVMTMSIPAFLFTLVSLYGMSEWAVGKQRAYLRDFPNYPKNRKAIIPFVL